MRGDYGPHHSPLQIFRLVYIALKFNICFNIYMFNICFDISVFFAEQSSEISKYIPMWSGSWYKSELPWPSGLFVKAQASVVLL